MTFKPLDQGTVLRTSGSVNRVLIYVRIGIGNLPTSYICR